MCGGGIYRDSLVMVTGATGTGKTLMSVQFIAAGLAAGERGLLLSFEENPSQLIRNARSWGVDLETARSEGRLRIVSRYPERVGLEDLLVEIKHNIDEFAPQRFAIDSMTALGAQRAAEGVSRVRRRADRLPEGARCREPDDDHASEPAGRRARDGRVPVDDH